MSDQPQDEQGAVEAFLSRRHFLKRGWLALGALACLQVLWMGVDILRPRKRRQATMDDDTLVIAGPVDRFAPGSVTAFPSAKFYLTRLDNGGFLALSRTCTHLGCTVPWVDDEQRFACPCHASVFDITGEVLAPPADRALDHYAVRIENGIVKVDMSETLRRRRYKSTQVVMP